MEIKDLLSNLEGNATGVVKSFYEVMKVATIMKDLGYTWQDGTELEFPNSEAEECYDYLMLAGGPCIFINKEKKSLSLGTLFDYDGEIDGDILFLGEEFDDLDDCE